VLEKLLTLKASLETERDTIKRLINVSTRVAVTTKEVSFSVEPPAANPKSPEVSKAQEDTGKAARERRKQQKELAGQIVNIISRIAVDGVGSPLMPELRAALGKYAGLLDE
jgi:hypothetical protein